MQVKSDSAKVQGTVEVVSTDTAWASSCIVVSVSTAI